MTTCMVSMRVVMITMVEGKGWMMNILQHQWHAWWRSIHDRSCRGRICVAYPFVDHHHRVHPRFDLRGMSLSTLVCCVDLFIHTINRYQLLRYVMTNGCHCCHWCMPIVEDDAVWWCMMAIWCAAAVVWYMVACRAAIPCFRNFFWNKSRVFER